MISTPVAIPLLSRNHSGKVETIAELNTKSTICVGIFKAVKKAEPNILNPLIKLDNEYILIAIVVISSNSLSYPTNILAKGSAKISAKIVMAIDVIVINFKLFPNKFLNSFLFPAP